VTKTSNWKKPDSEFEEKKELESKFNAVMLEEARVKQELTLLKHVSKCVRKENTDASIAANEALAMSKKFQKLLVEQQAKTVVARSTYASLKVGLHSYEQKHIDCTRELNEYYKTEAKDTDGSRFNSQIESLSELLKGEQDHVHVITEEIEDLEAQAEDLRFDCRALKYELSQQNGDNRRTKREIFDLQNSIDLKERMLEVMEELEDSSEI